jgi:AmpE protein
MTFLSILIALLLERVAPQLIEFRRFKWLREYGQWLVDVLHIEKLGNWLAFGALIAPLLVILWVLTGMFEHALFGLFEFAFNVAVVFFCLGPQDFDKQIDNYLDTIDVGEDEHRFTLASQFTSEMPASDLRTQTIQVCRSLFVEANTRIYAVLFWFVVFGPLAAVAYRVLEQWYRAQRLPASLSALRPDIGMLCGWADWIPARLSLFAYMISGSFEAGLQAYRNAQYAAVNNYLQNHELLASVGYQSLSETQADTPAQAMEMVRKTRGLILRSLVVWLLLLLLLSFIHH